MQSGSQLLRYISRSPLSGNSPFASTSLHLAFRRSFTRYLQHAPTRLPARLPSPSTSHCIARTLRSRRIRWNSTGSQTNLQSAKEKVAEKSLSASQKFKELSRKYGWAAVGVYLGLSVLDFPFCFLAVRMLGPERVGEAEHYIVDNFWKIVAKVLPNMAPKSAVDGEDASEEEVLTAEHAAGASIWTQLLLAYGVHKSLIFFRVPLTAAVTPKIVKYLRARGWKIGNPKAP